MAFKDELRDPWGWLLGLTAAGAAWAVNVPLAAALFVGIVVVAAKAALGLLQKPARTAGAPRLPVNPGSPEASWLNRAIAAADHFGDLAQTMGGGPLADRVATMRPTVDDTVATLERLAGQATMTGRALSGFDPRLLEGERRRLNQAKRGAHEDVVRELDKSLRSLKAQQEVFDRLSGTRDKVLAKLESGTLGLESLMARVVELSAMSATGPLESMATLEQVSGELEGIRQGLAEAVDITNRALGEVETPPPLPGDVS